MGIITRIFRRKLSEKEKEERSRKEQEWAQKCYNKGYEFSEKMSLDKHVARINEFANKYPRTFFMIIFAVLGVSIILNSMITFPSQNVEKTIQQLQETSVASDIPNPTSEFAQHMYEIGQSIQTIDRQITEIMSKGTLTHEDSLQVKNLLIQAQALQEIYYGENTGKSADSTAVNP